MEIVAESRVGSYGSCDISNEVKGETAALGFRVKSGWASVALLTGSISSPVLRDNQVINLSDLRETRQPYHAGFGELETDAKKIKRRTDIVHRVTKQSVTKLLEGYQRKGYSIARACLVIGSQLDPASIADPHIRAHALEGQLFRSALEEALNAHGIRTASLLERDAYVIAGAQLKKRCDDVRQTIQNLGRSIDAPWRAEQKLAAVSAWFSLGHKFGLRAIKRG
jgi:hypothetical protein